MGVFRRTLPSQKVQLDVSRARDSQLGDLRNKMDREGADFFKDSWDKSGLERRPARIHKNKTHQLSLQTHTNTMSSKRF